MNDYFYHYFKYVGVNEVPPIYHRWAALSIAGAVLARSVYIPFGHSNIYPNQYILLTGNPGARKGTAIGCAERLLRKTGYEYFAPDRNAKEAMWRTMAGQTDGSKVADLGSLDDLILEPDCAQLYIMKDEFVDFVGLGSDELVTNLANLWTNLSEFVNPKERANDIVIKKPTINILGGITPGGISKYFGALADEGGFFSRTLFIHGANTAEKVTWPTGVDTESEEVLVECLQTMKGLSGPIVLSTEVKDLLDTIYTTAPPIADRRLSYYEHRRFIHLLKLCIILTATTGTLECTTDTVVYANTILFAAETLMPQALGEYGKSRNSETTNHILDLIKKASAPVSVKELWKAVRTDLNKYAELLDILNSLLTADKIQTTQDKATGARNYLPVLRVENKWKPGLIDFGMLTMDECEG